MRRTCGFDLSYPRAILGFSRCRYIEAEHARLLCACIELTRSSDLDHNRAARVFDVMQVPWVTLSSASPMLLPCSGSDPLESGPRTLNAFVYSQP